MVAGAVQARHAVFGLVRSVPSPAGPQFGDCEGVCWKKKRRRQKEGTRPRSDKRQCRMVGSKGGLAIMGRSVRWW